MNSEELAAFSDELEKIAFPGGAVLRRGAQWLAKSIPFRGATATSGARWLTDSGALKGALVGGGVGGVGNAARAAYQGEDSRGILRAGLGGAVGGATLGAAGGGLGRKFRDVRLLDPTLSAGAAAKATVGSVGQGIKNFGKRQVHGITGAYKGQASEIGLGGTAAANKQVALERLRRADRLKGVVNNPKAQAKIWDETAKRNKELLEKGVRQQAALDAGVTSLRGIGQGMATKPKETLKAMWEHNAGKGFSGKAMGLGVPAALMAPELAKGDESATGGKSLTQKLMNTGAMVGGSVAFGGVPIVGNLIGWDAASRLSNLPFRGKKKPVLTQQPVQTGAWA